MGHAIHFAVHFVALLLLRRDGSAVVEGKKLNFSCTEGLQRAGKTVPNTAKTDIRERLK